MNMKSLLRTGTALLVLHCSGFASAEGDGWISDFAAAKKEAAESKKDLLVDFTGSDWCGWCIKLHKEVFDLEPFKTGVKDKFVLVDLDYPRDKSKLTPETIKQNEELAKQYGIKGYPTILLCDETGKPFAATGYREGGPEAYVKSLDELRAKRAARDTALASASKAEGVAKAKALVAALAAMGLEDEMVANFYSETVSQIKESDPKDETGFAKEAATKARTETVKKELGEILQKKDLDGAVAFLEKTLKEGGFDADNTQQMMATRGMIFADQKKFDEAIKAVDEAKAYAPESKWGASLDQIKGRFEEMKKKAAEPKPGT